jgi:anthranilate synthase component 1
MDFKKELDRLETGTIRPFCRAFPYKGDATDFFAKLSGYGRKKDCILLESADIIQKYGEMSIGSASPCLKVKGRGENFEVTAINPLGVRFLDFIKDGFAFADSVKVSKKRITGRLKAERRVVSEEERLKLVTHADVLRKIAFAFKPSLRLPIPYAGLFGAIGYDFIDQFEELPKDRKDILKQPDYEMNFYDNLFIVNHRKGVITFVATALLTGQDTGTEAERCSGVINDYCRAIKKPVPKAGKRAKKKSAAGTSTDTTKKDFIETVKRLKKNILNGDVFQAVVSRTITAGLDAEPLDVYRRLRLLNPSPYMFYFNSSSGILLGSSPETFLRVKGEQKKKVEIRPIAGTKPRGFIDGKIDPDLDSLARNDVAKISEAGTRHCDEPYIIEKYSHVQHLVSNVSGILKKDLDALHAYLACMNMGTLTGAPKVEAMKLIRLNEKGRRGFYGGSIGYLTPSGDFDSAIVIRAMSIRGRKAYIRAGAGIVHDSVPEKEFEETERKAGACLKAIELAQGGKE